jgi:hypothetical protein
MDFRPLAPLGVTLYGEFTYPSQRGGPRVSAGAAVRTTAGAQSWTCENYYAPAASPKYTETPSR